MNIAAGGVLPNDGMSSTSEASEGSPFIVHGVSKPDQLTPSDNKLLAT